jgi:hypothetical protein
VPALAGAIGSAALVVPAYVRFEPVHQYERVGPVVPALGVLTFVVGLVSAAWLVRAWWTTRRIVRAWSDGARPLATAIGSGVPEFTSDTAPPIVALVGTVRPHLLAARAIVDACSARELALVAAHERGHLLARDNLTRLVLGALPDVLRLTSIHHAIVRAWHAAAEDAADDHAAGACPRTRAQLAAVIVKIARLSSGDCRIPVALSPFVEIDGVDRRVRRLVAETPPVPPEPRLARASGISVALAALAAASCPPFQRVLHEAVELLVAAGR